MKITIAGDLGSGKSTIGKAIAKEWKYNFYSTGDIFRKLSAEKGLNILEGNKLGEYDRSFDDEVDNYSAKIGKQEDDFIFDSRLAWHFIPDSLSIYFYCDAEIAAKRIYSAQRDDERTTSVEDMILSNKARRLSEIKRYQDLYGLDILKLTNYDLVLDTSYHTSSELVEWLMAAIQKGRKGIYLSPKTIDNAADIDEITETNKITTSYSIDGWKADKQTFKRLNPKSPFVPVTLL